MADEIIQEYIQNQDIEERVKSDNFDIGQLSAASAANRTYRLQPVEVQSYMSASIEYSVSNI